MEASKDCSSRTRQTTRARPLSMGDMSAVTEQSSTIYGMLPTVVTSRIRRLSSVRNCVNVHSRYVKEDRPDNSESNSGLRTPPPKYSALETERVQNGTEDLQSNLKMGEMSGYEYTADGVHWMIASRGVSLLQLACQSNSTTAKNSAALSRKAYIDSVTYLIQALPEQMDRTETESVRAALPNGVLLGLHDKEECFKNDSEKLSTDDLYSVRSLVRRFVAAAIVNMCILVSFLLPYIRFILAKALKYERDHHICERVFGAGIRAVDGVGTRGLKCANILCQLNNGKIGQALSNCLIWWVEGVAGGIHQGFRDGLIVLENSRKT